MRRLTGNPDWKPKDGYVWHHQAVDGLGNGQMVLVEEKVHRAAVHKGARGIWNDVLKARKAGNRSAKTAAHMARRTLGFLGKVARVAGPAAVVYCTFNTAANGWADDGAVGAGRALIRDAVFADEVEALAQAQAEFIANQLMLNNQGDQIRLRDRARQNGIDQRGLFPGGTSPKKD